jgi:hypothetical protein
MGAPPLRTRAKRGLIGSVQKALRLREARGVARTCEEKRQITERDYPSQVYHDLKVAGFCFEES